MKTKNKSFNILEHVFISPKVTPLNEIPQEKKFVSLLDSVRLTKIHSLESILRHFISENEIKCMDEHQMRERIKYELQLIYHILPDRISL